MPLDYSDPGGKTIGLAISRLKAGSTKERRGVLLLNPGGPGAAGLHLPVDPLMKFPAEVKRRYDLVGFDPRGAGQSSPVSCGLTAEEQSDQPYKAETFAKDAHRVRTVAGKCRTKAGDKLPHLTTRNSARDMDVIRAALGEKRVSYLGISYGTYLGAVYMQLFPSAPTGSSWTVRPTPRGSIGVCSRTWRRRPSRLSRDGPNGPSGGTRRTDWATPRPRSARPSGI
ncbi:alpha/beta fold hydrolase [Streptomyces sp. NPDC056831]|uniref:alpha/beta fold hydrolase n=1 Tax=Streptomyces sp. NPDC056831 TaxID=3345954 RepID=UPI003674CDB9